MRGSGTRVSRKNGSGCILSEDGNEVHFERSAVASNGTDEENLRAGHYVEFELQYGFECPCAVNIKRLHRDHG
jgi:cold shock CspA family protein